MRRFSIPIALCLAIALTAGCGGGGNNGTVAPPEITGVEPASGGATGGTVVLIRGTNLANTEPGTLAVTIGGQPAAWFQVIDSTTIECETPPGPLGPADVQIVNQFGADTATDGFMYYSPPIVTSITPPKGTRDGGTTVTIAGSGFTANDPGETVCRIGLKELLNVDIVNDSTITGVTPSSWTEVFKDVTVTNGNGEGLLPLGYTYVGPPPEIHTVSPSTGSRSGGELLLITGIELTGSLSVRIGENLSPLVNPIDDLSLTCITPVRALAGVVDVTVINHNGEFTLPNSFEYLLNPLPSSIDPTEGTVSGGTDVTILGEDFLGGGPVTVWFGANQATNVIVWDPTRITCTTPAGSEVGTTTVTVQNDNGGGTVPGGFEYTAPEFWWEETFGTRLSGNTSWSSYHYAALPYGFPFYGSTYGGVYVLASGQLQFGSVTTGQFSIDIHHTQPCIAPLAGLLYPVNSGAIGVYQTDHVPDRTIFTWNTIPEYMNLGSNSFQVHLLNSGIFAIVYKDTTYNMQYQNFGVQIKCGVSRGTTLGATEVPVDWTSGPLSSDVAEAFVQRWSNGQSGDLDNGVLTFNPNAAGGFDSNWFVGAPADPDP